MSTTTFKTLLAAAVLGTAAACGNDGGPSWSNTVDVNNANMAAADAANWATSVSEGILDFNVSTEIPLVRGVAAPDYPERLIARIRRQALARVGHGTPGALASPFTLNGTCEPVETGVDALGDPIDTDHDDIPDDYKIDFGAACTDSEGEYSVTYSGALRIRDAAGLFGYRLDALHFKARWVHLAEYEQFTLNGYETGAYTSSAAALTTDMDYGEAWHYVAAAAPPMEIIPSGTGTVTWSLVAHSAYDPDGTIALGAPMPSGLLDLDADYRVRYAGDAGSDGFHFVVASTTPLSIEATPCEGPVAGVLDGELNGDADIGFTVTWTACHTATITTRGTTGGTTSARR
ncbi:MAG TPA: hypothetical protein VG940_03955 [Gemmatimonadales bacterium]|nr:hypothetical protein [Gemmatimonadales bacterium]